MKEITYNSEGDVKKQVKKILDAHNFFWWMPPANGYGVSGVSDFVAIRKGVVLAIETKFKKNKPTQPQKLFLESIMAEDGYGFVVNEKNIETFREFLLAFDRAALAYATKQKETPEDGAIMLNAIKELTEMLV